MIVLGIDTSTPQTSVAIGTRARDPRPACRSRGRPGRSRSRPRSSSSSMDRHRARAGRRHRGRDRARAVHGPAGGRGDGEVARPGARACRSSGIASLDVLAFAVRSRRGAIAAVIDARRGEVFFALTERCPAASARRPSTAVASPDAPGRRAAGRWPGRCCSSATVPSCTGMSSKQLGRQGRVRLGAVAHPDAAAAGRARRAPVPAGGARPAVRRRADVPEEVGCGDRLGSASPRRLGLR